VSSHVAQASPRVTDELAFKGLKGGPRTSSEAFSLRGQ
jgi:hypothetical protein